MLPSISLRSWHVGLAAVPHLDDWSLLLGNRPFPSSSGPWEPRLFCQILLPPHLAPAEQQFLHRFTPDLVLPGSWGGWQGANVMPGVKHRGYVAAPQGAPVGVPEEVTARCGVITAALGVLGDGVSAGDAGATSGIGTRAGGTRAGGTGLQLRTAP